MNYVSLIAQISEEDILKLLADYGAVPFRIKPEEIWFKTICHGGDSHKLCYFRKDKSFYCYTNCGSMNLVNFIAHVLNIDYSMAYSFLERRFCRYIIGADTEKVSPIENYEQINRYLSYREIKQDFNGKLPEYDDKILKYFDKKTFYEGWLLEGISFEAMEKYEISWYPYEKYIIIPHRDIEGRLVGIRRRSLQEKDSKNKYTPLMMPGVGKIEEYAHSLGMNLYGAYYTQQAIKNSKKAIVVEGEKSVLKGETYYGDHNILIATCGFSLSSFQLKMLLGLGVQEIILGFDKDFEIDQRYVNKNTSEYQKYYAYVNKIFNIASKITPFASVSVLWDKNGILKQKDSPIDEGKECFERLMAERVYLNTTSTIEDLLLWKK